MNKSPLVARPLRSAALLLAACVPWLAAAAAPETNAPAPRLVVGIVVDQMRYDFIYRYWDKYPAEGGFKRLLREGAFYRNAQYNYAPTFTGPGHASIFTGATPSAHGIAGNEWYERSLGQGMYCVDDNSVTAVGGPNASVGRMSPRNLRVTTITDELKLAHPNHAKVIGVSIKDRAAILPAGHLADAAYWFDATAGQFISSTYYTFPATNGVRHLPPWALTFNSSNYPARFLTNVWNPANLGDFSESVSPAAAFGKKLSPNEDHLGFPHDLRKLSQAAVNRSSKLLLATPYGNELTAAFAEAAVVGEQLGQGDRTDFLTINFASTDYAGHQFGPRSAEVEDTYLQFDRQLGDLLTFLTRQVGGAEHLLVFLTADHGVAEVPEFSQSLRLPGGRFPMKHVIEKLNTWVLDRYQVPLVLAGINQQIYLDRDTITARNLDVTRIEAEIRDRLLKEPGVVDVFPAREMAHLAAVGTIPATLARGLHAKRSGDLVILLESGWLEESADSATSHGTPYQYDTHVPIFFWGWQVPHLSSDEPVAITQIAPTVAQMLNLQFPSASDNRVLPGLLGIHAEPGEPGTPKR